MENVNVCGNSSPCLKTGDSLPLEVESPAPTNVGTKVLDVHLLLLYYEGGYFFSLG